MGLTVEEQEAEEIIDADDEAATEAATVAGAVEATSSDLRAETRNFCNRADNSGNILLLLRAEITWHLHMSDARASGNPFS
jgi:hypothetical protein